MKIPEQLLTQAQGTGVTANRAASRLMTLLENEPKLQAEFLQRTGLPAEPHLILGVTGAPGSGKSTLVDALVTQCRQRFPKWKIGVLAVDPSSPFTGGAILGDRVRMMRHCSDSQVFVRSLASRGHLGGLSMGVSGVLAVLRWLEYDLIILETVGVGQSEVEITRVADEVAVVLAPGQGDSIQLLKAGLMEIGSVIVINKADRGGADILHADVLNSLQLEAHTEQQREVALVSATEQKGVGELLEILLNRANRRAPTIQASRERKRTETTRDLLLRLANRRLVQAMEAEQTVSSLHGKLLDRAKIDWDSVTKGLLERAAAISEP